MPEVNAPQAAKIIGVSLTTIHRAADSGKLPAREQGQGELKYIFVDISDLRQFAQKYGYRFNEELVNQYTNK